MYSSAAFTTQHHKGFLNMLTKTQQIDNITIDENNIVHVRTTTVIAEDGKELSRTYHRNTLSPGADISEQDPRVVAIATAAWNFADN